MSTLPNRLDLSYKHIFAIAIPVVLANLAMPIQSAIDIAVVGHFNSPSSLAGLGLATQLLSLILVSLNFLQYASSGLAAQALGRVTADQSDNEQITEGSRTNNRSINFAARTHLKHILQRSLVLAVILAIVLLLFRPLLIEYGLQLLAAKGANNIAATTYLNVRMLGVMFELMNFAFIGWFAGQGLSKLMLYQQGFIAISNIILTLFFVYITDFGLMGVALGTTIAYVLGILLAANLAARYLHIPFISLFRLQAIVFDKSHMLRLFSLNKDIFVRTLILTLSFTWITRLSALQGDVVLATNAILLQVLTISAFALDGVAVAAESLSGQSASHGKPRLFDKVVQRTGTVIFVLAGLLSSIWCLLMPIFINTMTDINVVMNLAKDYKLIAALLPLAGAGAYWLDGIMFGLTAGTIIRRSAIIMALIFFPISYAVYTTLSPQGMAMLAIWISVYILLILRFIINAAMLYRYKTTLLNPQRF